MEIQPIKTKRDYPRALTEIEALMAAKRRTPEGDRTTTVQYVGNSARQNAKIEGQPIGPERPCFELAF